MTFTQSQAGAMHWASPLPEGATSALRCWLQAERRAYALGAAVRPGERRTVVRHLCDAARARHVRVEQVIVLLKQLWVTVPPDPAGDRWPHPGAERELLDGIIRLCIEEFYAPAHPGRVALSEYDDRTPA